MNEAIDFRAVPKENPGGMIPKKLDDRIRKEAFRRRESISAILTKYVALGMGESLESFGLEHLAPQPESVPAA